MMRRPPVSSRTAPLFPYTPRFRSDRPAGPVSSEILLRDKVAPLQSGTSDAAALIGRLPGGSSFGAGGFSSLPVIRGLESQRLTILVDGVPIDIACTNAMNPPLSYTDPQTIDAISVITGVTPVSMGGDSIGGAIWVETLTPRLAKADRKSTH